MEGQQLLRQRKAELTFLSPSSLSALPVPRQTFTPAQFGALFGFLVAYRGDLSVLSVTFPTSSHLFSH
jgi:hypothetical protein